MNIPNILLIEKLLRQRLNTIINYSIEELEKIHIGYCHIYYYPNNPDISENSYIAYRTDNLVIYYNINVNIFTFELFDSINSIKIKYQRQITKETVLNQYLMLNIILMLKDYIELIMYETGGQISS